MTFYLITNKTTEFNNAGLDAGAARRPRDRQPHAQPPDDRHRRRRRRGRHGHLRTSSASPSTRWRRPTATRATCRSRRPAISSTAASTTATIAPNGNTDPFNINCYRPGRRTRRASAFNTEIERGRTAGALEDRARPRLHGRQRRRVSAGRDRRVHSQRQPRQVAGRRLDRQVRQRRRLLARAEDVLGDHADDLGEFADMDVDAPRALPARESTCASKSTAAR